MASGNRPGPDPAIAEIAREQAQALANRLGPEEWPISLEEVASEAESAWYQLLGQGDLGEYMSVPRDFRKAFKHELLWDIISNMEDMAYADLEDEEAERHPVQIDLEFLEYGHNILLRCERDGRYDFRTYAAKFQCHGYECDFIFDTTAEGAIEAATEYACEHDSDEENDEQPEE